MNTILRSMAARLTLVFGLIALVVLSGAGVLIYRALVEELRRSGFEELQGKLKAVQHFVDEAKSESKLSALSHHLDDILIGHDHMRVWLLSDKGETIYGSRPMPQVQHTDARSMLSLVLAGDVPYVGIKGIVNTDPRVPFREALVAIDQRPQEKLLTSYRRTLTLICALGVFLAMGMGAMATRRGLLPVKRLSKSADQIAPDSLGTRLPVHGVDMELVDMTRAFNSALDRVESAYRHQEAFNANVAHELRTPLNTLINGAQITLSSQRTNDALRDTLASNLEELERLKSIVNDMLFLAKADQGEKALALELVELADEVKKSLEFFEPVFLDAEVEFSFSGDALCRCNPSLVRRALVNLLSNAVKHTPSGKGVHVQIESLPGLVKLSVSNSGAVLSDHVKAHMFDRFFRADQARAQPGESTGLGLAIVRAIARMHGGDVAAQSEGDVVTVAFTMAKHSSSSE